MAENSTNGVPPWELAKLIAAHSKPKGGNSREVADWRKELEDLVGPEEAKRLIAQAREARADFDNVAREHIVEAKPHD